MKNSLFYILTLIGLVFAIYLVGNSQAHQCFSTQGENKKWNENGTEVDCRIEAGATKRKCIKFKTDARPGKVIRECDHIYEKLFGYTVFNTGQADGCYAFDTMIGTKRETGTYCISSEELGNGGPLKDA